MLSSVKKLVRNLNEENQYLKEENDDLKKELKYRRVELNDLRFSKREMAKRMKVLAK
jgi:regulator of replication initiation timing